MIYRVTSATTSLHTYEVEAESEAEAIEIARAQSGKLVSASVLWDAVKVGDGGGSGKRVPTGFGTYLRRISGGEAEARSVLAHCQQAKMTWVSLMVEAEDGYTVPLSVTQTYAAIFRENGFRIFVWTFPGDARAASAEASKAAGKLALEYAQAIEANGVMLDIEKPYKGKQEALHALVSEVRGGLTEEQTLGMVSYPVPAYHETIPWEEFKVADWGSPMFYDSAGNATLVERGFVEWGAFVPVIVPSLDGWSGSGAFGANRLTEDIIRVCGAPPVPRVPAALIWSEQQMDDAKRLAVANMASRYSWA